MIRWSRSYGTKNGEVLIENINCMGLAMDTEAFLYVSDGEKPRSETIRNRQTKRNAGRGWEWERKLTQSVE